MQKIMHIFLAQCVKVESNNYKLVLLMLIEVSNLSKLLHYKHSKLCQSSYNYMYHSTYMNTFLYGLHKVLAMNLHVVSRNELKSYLKQK